VRSFPDLHYVALALWERTADSLDTGDLRWIAGILEHAGVVTRNLSAVVDGIRCFVARDKEVGGFQEPGDVSSLLFFIAESMNSRFKR
jgi:hypothetical protein